MQVPMNIPFPPPMKFTGDKATEWKRFKAQWLNYLTAAKLNGEPDERKVALLLACIGADGFAMYDGLPFATADDRQKIDKVLEVYENQFVPQTNICYERWRFNERYQQAGESFDTYLADLRQLVKTCNYGSMEDELMRDRIICGVRNEQTRTTLFNKKKLDLAAAINICRTAESSSSQLRAMSKTDKVQSLHKDHPERRRSQSRGRRDDDRRRSNSKGRGCRCCGKQHAIDKKACPAFGKKCTYCSKLNHFASVCMAKQRSTPHATVNQLDNIEDDEEVFTLNSSDSKRLYSRLDVGGKRIRFLLDCGATVNLLPAALLRQLDISPSMVRPAAVTLRMFDRTALKTDGMITLLATHPTTGQYEHIDFYIATTHNQPLLGLEACLLFDLLAVKHENICTLQQSAVSNQTTVQNPELSADVIFSTFSDLFEGYGMLDGEVHLDIDPNVTPVRLPLRKLPVPIKDKVGRELQHLQDEGIIAPVREPTAWISALLVVSKANGGIRICIDPKPLNKALLRDHYPMPTIDDILPKLSDAKVFSTVDAKNAFWHLCLDEESSKLTTFETPFGKFKWLRLPYGVSPAPELFQRRLHEVLSGLPGVACIADDILVFGCGSTVTEAQIDHDKNLLALLHRCREKNVKLNRDKMKLNRCSVHFMGHELTNNGLKSDMRKVDAVLSMPAATDRQGVMRLLGMATYLARFTPAFSDVVAPIRELLRRDIEFRWDEAKHGEAFNKLKHLLTSTPVLAYYDVRKEVTVQCDSSKAGLGCVLLQDGRPVEYASRALTPTEQSYAQIEKELLAIVFAMERLHTYVYGRHVTIETDHKPLITIVKKALTSAPKRLQRMLLRLQRYDFTLIFKPGTQVIIADTLSRAYPENSAVQTPFTAEIAALVDAEQSSELQMIASAKTIQLLRDSAAEDETYQLLRQQIRHGWPEREADVPSELRKYHTFADELTNSGDFVYKGSCIVVPFGAREELLDRIHRSHIGINGCIRRARDSLYWPGMTSQIRSRVEHCNICQQYQASSAREPLHPHDVPTRQWEKVGVDIFTFRNHDYLVTVDYLSNYFEIDRLPSKRAKDIIYCVRQHFARHGIPAVVFTDNSPFNCAEFKQFAYNYEFEHQTSSPRFPQSNGKVENAVKTAKGLMTKAADEGLDQCFFRRRQRKR